MQRLPVQSRALRSAGYDAESEELELEFHSGQVYRYERVPRSVYDWLLRAPNKGVFVTRQITGRYVERCVTGVPATPPDALSDRNGSGDEVMNAAAGEIDEWRLVRLLPTVVVFFDGVQD